MKKFYIVPHSHLDREWYRTFQENRIKLVHFMDDLLEVMEHDKRYKYYSLDAQTSFIDDYFDVRPEMKEVFKKHVQSGALPIGPWYVQPDEHLPTAEGIIRNLLISKNISDEYGDFMKLGYCPDAFGQSSTFPTLMKGFGINSALFYRGFAESDSKFNDFIWQGLDGSEIVATWMPIGYGNAMFLCEDDEKNKKEIENNIELLSERNISDNYLLMCGSDQSYVKKFLPKTIERLNELYKEEGYEFVLATQVEYMNEVMKYKDKMEVVKGELRKGKRSRTHNSIGATRYDIKFENFEVENKYLNILEPLNALAKLYNVKSDSNVINRGWKYIVENHAHDSICCCCTDDIHKEIKMRMLYANQISNYLTNEKFEKLHESIAYKKIGRPILIYSSFLGKRKQMISTDVFVKNIDFSIYDTNGNKIEYQINKSEKFNLKDTKVSFTPIPDDFYEKVNISFYVETVGFGYKTIYIKENETPKITNESMVTNKGLENDFTEVIVNEDGSLKVVDKVKEIIFDKQHIFVDDGNAGDEYDYSPSFNDKQITSLNCLKNCEWIKDTPLEATMRLTYQMEIPKMTTNNNRSEELTTISIISDISLRKEDDEVYIKTKINNTAYNHRIQVYFDLHERVSTNFANIQLGEIVRDNEFKETETSMSEGWHEYYYPVFNQHIYSGLKNDEGKGFVIFNKGIPQYEIKQEDSTKLAITLLSCVGFMGNTDLKYRPGRRSGSTDETKDSQMQGEYSFEYAFKVIYKEKDYIAKAYSYINTAIAKSYAEYSNEGALSDELVIAESNTNVMMTTFKESENTNTTILRIVNPYANKIENVEVKVNRFLFDKINVCNLAEENINDTSVFIKKLNNPDGSDLAKMSGIIEIKEIANNALKSFELLWK